MRIAKRIILITAIAVCCVGCDQTTKSLAQAMLSETEAWSFLGDSFRLQLAYNRGAFLGLGASLPAGWREGLFSVGVSGVLLALLAIALFSRSVSRSDIVAFALLFAGGVGNLIDRVYAGYVVDFMNIGIGALRTGIFNVADIAVTAGVLLLIADMLLSKKSDQKTKSTNA
jgi:signal peptidase II